MFHVYGFSFCVYLYLKLSGNYTKNPELYQDLVCENDLKLIGYARIFLRTFFVKIITKSQRNEKIMKISKKNNQKS